MSTNSKPVIRDLYFVFYFSCFVFGTGSNVCDF